MFGRLVRVRTHRGDREATLYIVAEPEAEKAIDLLKIALARFPITITKTWGGLQTACSKLYL